MLIAVEGMDGCGKTTMAKVLAQALGDRAKFGFEPTDNPVGSFIRKLLEEKSPIVRSTSAPFLFTADRLLHQKEMLDWYSSEAGRVYVTDRYYHSTIVYQYLFRLYKENLRPGERYDWILQQVKETVAGMVPQVTLLFMADPDVCLERMAKVRGVTTEFEKRDHLDLLCRGYNWLYTHNPLKERMVIIDSNQTKEQVWEDVVDTLGERTDLFGGSGYDRSLVFDRGLALLKAQE